MSKVSASSTSSAKTLSPLAKLGKLSTLGACLASLVAPVGLTSVSIGSAHAAGRLTVYCTAISATCEAITKAFAEKYNVKAGFIRQSSGTMFAKIFAEKNNPQGDVVYGGTVDPQSQAGELGLLQSYLSPNREQIDPRFREPVRVKNNLTTAVNMGVVGWAVNLDRLQKLGIEKVPTCWADLLDPRLKQEVQMADVQSSGTAYTTVASILQLFGEEKGWDYIKKLDANVNQYTKSGVTPPRAVARGETAVGIAFLHDLSMEKNKGANIQVVAPCEGTGYDLGAVSIIKGARNLENAKLFVDFALSVEGQEVTWKVGGVPNILTNVNAEQSPDAPAIDSLKLINYDNEKYGSDQVRKDLINRWLSVVKVNKEG